MVSIQKNCYRYPILEVLAILEAEVKLTPLPPSLLTGLRHFSAPKELKSFLGKGKRSIA